ncbi:MAG: zinc dependent phospholipase C family protein [Oscillospiraceae bacterium]|nr:zinc dependent phospholipase C family protein [Oscillospiraceae bacterium]
MPSLYAHDVFGRKVAARLPFSEKKAILQFPQLYRLGLQGPDILFFYNPFQKNPVGREGSAIHHRPARVFFEHAREKWIAGGKRPEQLSYLMGFLCHFMLDSSVHGYIEEQIQVSGVGHVAIETEFDRMMLVMEKKKADAFRLGYCVPDDKGMGQVLAPFYPGIRAETLDRSVKAMRFYKNLLVLPQKPMRETVYAALRRMGKYEALGPHIMNAEPDPRCRLICEALYKKLEKAVNETVRQQKKLLDAFWGGCVLDPRLDRDFE